MEINKLNILFVISKSRINKAGLAPLFCRITYQEERKQFATGLFVNPSQWQNNKQKANPPNEYNKFINSQLSLIKNEINQAFLFLQLQKSDFDTEKIYKQYKGETQNEDKTLMDVFNYHNNKMKSLVGIEGSINSWERYHNTHNHIKDFLWFKFKRKDMKLKDIQFSFITDLEYYLKVEKKFKPTTTYRSIGRFRKVIRVAVAMDYLIKDPFILYRTKEPKKEIIYLTMQELNLIENHKFASDRLQQVADMFIFCCYTGLAFQEMANLKKENIINKFDDNLWIEMYRQKTQRKFSVPLLLKAITIIDKYQYQDNVLPVISNQRFNSYLKEIAEITGINKTLTHHIARKTFATTILLYNDIPIEIVSELLGHSKITMTQEHYAKIMDNKINEYMIELGKKLK
ncbi:integrase [Chryseobacterium sp. Leaf405]|uniref:site-specific integrase n=1 Tax=Chryseobacterium sp. Leaf405 TaxID=1736367 RepID=UPI0006FB020C|nr:site-specific integrase [Chryseobacterium sp. Leaf405]KQT25893.1 integrase [Chryseobacterium sp. Leaf405]